MHWARCVPPVSIFRCPSHPSRRSQSHVATEVVSRWYSSSRVYQYDVLCTLEDMYELNRRWQEQDMYLRFRTLDWLIAGDPAVCLAPALDYLVHMGCPWDFAQVAFSSHLCNRFSTGHRTSRVPSPLSFLYEQWELRGFQSGVFGVE